MPIIILLVGSFMFYIPLIKGEAVGDVDEIYES
jgi:hypothetical protein